MQDGFLPVFRDDGAGAQEKSSFALSSSATFRRKETRKKRGWRWKTHFVRY
jgi:hypothetical protein